MSYRDPLYAARARIAALEDLIDSRRFEGGVGEGDDQKALREARAALAEERALHDAETASLRRAQDELSDDLARVNKELVDERARRQVEVSLLRSKLEEAERAVTNNATLFEAEQTMQRAEVAAQSARLADRIVHKDTTIRELREEVRIHLSEERVSIRAYYEARVRAVGTELAEHGAHARRLEISLEAAREAVHELPPADVRDREGMVEREMAKRKVAIAEAERERLRERIGRLESELERITQAEAALASRS